MEIKEVINTHTINRDSVIKEAIESSRGLSKELHSPQQASALPGFSFSLIHEHIFHAYLVDRELVDVRWARFRSPGTETRVQKLTRAGSPGCPAKGKTRKTRTLSSG